MKKISQKMIGLLAALQAFAAFGAGVENSVGGAGDNVVIPAFFRSTDENQAVVACVEVASDFGIVQTKIESMIRTGFQQWSAYLVQKKLRFGGRSAVFIQTRLELHSSCTGSENLSFYLGVTNPLVEKYKHLIEHPYGFAKLLQKGVGPKEFARGFVWIVGPEQADTEKKLPKWNSLTEPALAALLLHEIGHVFGNTHVAGTVMTPEIAEFLAEDTEPKYQLKNLKFYDRIDSQIELIPCMGCKQRYRAEDSLSLEELPDQKYNSDLENAMFALAEREPEGKVFAHYDKVGTPAGNGMLTLMDDRSKETFYVDIYDRFDHPGDAPLFAGHVGKFFYSSVHFYGGVIRTKSGKKIEVNVNFNINGRKITIKEKSNTDRPERDNGRILFRSAD